MGLSPARLAYDDQGLPLAPDYGDVYHARAGALAQARHVFLGGNGLPERWRGRQRFVIFENGFGLGHNFLTTWAAWRADPARPARLIYLAVEKHPLSKAEAQALHGRKHEAEVAPLAAQLAAAWPPATPDLHGLDFEGGQVQLLLALGDVQAWLKRGLQAEVDAYYLDGFAPDRNPAMWSPELMQRLARLAAPGATAATWSAARAVRDGLAAAGFEVERHPGLAGKLHMTVARYAPRHHPERPRALAPRLAAAVERPANERRAIVIGAGLAGCAAAWALARQGWQVELLDARATPAQGTSGNTAGLMHAILNEPDSLHARWYRAGALRMARVLQASMDVTGAHLLSRAARPGEDFDLSGFLRLDPGLADAAARARLARLGLPEEIVRWCTAAEAAEWLGLPLDQPGAEAGGDGSAEPAGGWWFGQAGGWVRPPAACRHFLALAGEEVQFRGGLTVERLERRLVRARADGGGDAAGEAPGTTPLWQAYGADGQLIAQAPVVVLANAGDVPRLLQAECMQDHTPAAWQPATLPALSANRGQTTVIDLDALDETQFRSLHLPRHALSGQGYALHVPAPAGSPGRGQLLIGATTQRGDGDPELRLADQHENLQRAASLGIFGAQARRLGQAPDWALALPLAGRVGWRLVAPDRLPLIGPLVDLRTLQALKARRQRVDLPHLQPRCHDEAGGLYLCTALASRGLSSAALAGELLAAWVTGAPCPVDNELRARLDPARFGPGPAAEPVQPQD